LQGVGGEARREGADAVVLVVVERDGLGEDGRDVLVAVEVGDVLSMSASSHLLRGAGEKPTNDILVDDQAIMK
jgi:hypothetical protein